MVGITGITMEIVAVRNTTGIDIKVSEGAERSAPFLWLVVQPSQNRIRLSNGS